MVTAIGTCVASTCYPRLMTQPSQDEVPYDHMICMALRQGFLAQGYPRRRLLLALTLTGGVGRETESSTSVLSVLCALEGRPATSASLPSTRPFVCWSAFFTADSARQSAHQ
jgi:hypothetical protein